MTSYQIQSELETLTFRAVADFMFPQYSLAYEIVPYDKDVPATINPLTGIGYGYFFTSEDVGQKEYNVI